ncbi:SIMPL domain-containing protein [Oceanimonas sp. CHS3-5]|uniref:SIMPL domain-containing protein n=1 Tax=Oceanimonas sp. CHS3-5 TaxID=3068186 RepID=UPI00273EFBE9|nr:SIMPL domain-containing protein [Oceanimonas sp. CHS3-5]MDP5291611.1 SIMPL domain-containing protein [Oceanimonas sp. CHS3-5]
MHKKPLSALLSLPLLFSSAVFAIAVPDAPHLMTQGEASISVAPDMATLDLAVTAVKKDSRQAKEEVDTRVAALFSGLSALGVKKADIDSGNLVTRPNYDYSKNGKRELKGYSAERTVTIRLYQLDNLSQVLDTALAQGVQNVQRIRYGVRESEGYQQQARQAAMAHARELAGELASGFEQALGEVYAIEYAGQPPVQPRPLGATRMMAADAAQESYQQNEIEFTDRVRVVYTLK